MAKSRTTKKKSSKKKKVNLNFSSFRPAKCISWLRSRSLMTKILLSIVAIFIFLMTVLYGFAVYYRWSNRDVPLKWGISWSTKYAQELGIDSREGLQAVADELPIKRYRFMSYWDLHEPVRDEYDWSELDFQMQVAKNSGAEVSLAIGLRQPRWPECHTPQWAKDLPREEWLPELKDYMRAIIERYDQNGVVVEYQLENEFLTAFFGECPDHDRDRLIEEYDFVTSLTDHTVVVSRSNNFLPSWPISQPRAERTAFSIYKRVYDAEVTKTYVEYPYPAWYYGAIAQLTEAHTGAETFIHELQAEPWGPGSTANLTDEQQKESMDAKRLKKRLSYAQATGMKTIDIWGGEWYYWRKTQWDDPSLWQTIQQELPKYK